MNKSTFQNDPSTSKPTSTSVIEDGLASDFMYQLHLLTAPSCIMELRSTSVSANSKNQITCKQSDPRQLHASKCLEFSVLRPDDKKEVWVYGLLCVSDNVVVVDNDNRALKLFDQNGVYISSTDTEYYTWGITNVGDGTFATCEGNNVYSWTVRRQGMFRRRQKIVRDDVLYHVNNGIYDFHFNGTYFCVLHRYDHAITLLDRKGRQVRDIAMKEACGKKFTFGLDIHMDSDTNNIYLPCWNEDGVLCVTIKGQALWFTEMSCPTGITEIQGTLCVADSVGFCLHLISKEGEYVRKLLYEKDVNGNPRNMCHGHNGRLYVSYSFPSDKITMYTVT